MNSQPEKRSLLKQTGVEGSGMEARSDRRVENGVGLLSMSMVLDIHMHRLGLGLVLVLEEDAVGVLDRLGNVIALQVICEVD